MFRVVLAVMVSASCGRVGFGAHDGGATDSTLGGDGDNDGAATPSVDGFWIVEQLQLVGEQVPRFRSDLVNGFRADALISSGVHRSRGMALSNGFGQGILEETGQLTIEGDSWILTVDGNVWVAAMTWLDQDTLALSVDLDDPRAQGEAPPLTEITYRRTSPPPDLGGDWILSAAEYPGTGEFLTGVCFTLGTDSARMTGTVSTSVLHVSTPSFRFNNYNGLGCVGTPMTIADTGVAYVEVTGTAVRSWLDTVSLGKIAQTGTIEDVAGGHRLVFTSCVPASTCVDAPLMLELVRP